MRAIAVLAVTACHADVPGFQGGFLGVDIFFVLSGFLITGLIQKDLECGTFSFARFYERRVRRILPALLLVIAVTLGAAPFFMWPWQVEDLGQSAVTAALGLSNILFHSQTDYFSPAAETLPLLHTWSLAVEEQFYLLYPALLWLVWRLSGRLWSIVAAVAILTTVSFWLAVAHAPTRPDAVHFLTHYRAFELGLGALGAFAVRLGLVVPRTVAPRLALGCLAVVLASVPLLTPGTATPMAKLPLLLGTLGVLLAGGERGVAGTILKARPMVWLGVISYSLYLWHQPVLAYAHLHWGALSPGLLIGLFLLILGLSALSWRFVEEPARRAAVPRAMVFRGATVAALVVLSAGSVFVRSPAEIAPVSMADRDLATPPAERALYLWEDYAFAGKDRFEDPEQTQVLLVGDSFSQDMFALLKEGLAPGTAEIVVRHIVARCQPYLGGEDVSHHLAPGDRAICADRAAMAPAPALLEEADLVVLAASWRDWTAAMLSAVAADYAQPGRPLVIVGTKSFADEGAAYHPRRFSGMQPGERAALWAKPSATRRNINAVMKSTEGPWAYVDMLALICGDALKCPLFTPEGMLVSHDGSHLTQAGAAFLAPKVLADPAFDRLWGRGEATAGRMSR